MDRSVTAHLDGAGQICGKLAISRSHPQTCPDGQVWTKSVFLLDRARPAKVSRAAARRPSGGFSLARPTGPPRKPSEAVFVGRGERSGAVRALPFRRGECSAAFFDDNGGCNAHAASLRQQKRTGPFGPALLRRKQKPAFIPRASPGRYAAHPAASGWLPKMDGAILGALTRSTCSAEMNSACAKVLPGGKTLVRA